MSVVQMIAGNPGYFFGMAVLFIYSLIAHELSHAVVAYAFGDRTAERAGRITLNPFAHLDPLGSLMLLIAGFGWANPVPINPENFRFRRLGMFCVSLSGCAANILIAAVLLLGLVTLKPDNDMLLAMIMRTVQVNIILGSFNLIPMPPLDGSRILMSMLPARGQELLARIEPYGFFILIGLLFTGILDPVIIFIQGLIMAMIGSVLRFVPMG